MICNRTEDGWEIVYQRAHALLAAKLVTYWLPDQRPLRWTETLNAVAQHDNGWQEWEDRSPLTEAGMPRTFTEMPLEESLVQARRVVERAWHQSQWVGLLVSRHVARLYGGRRGELDALDALLDEHDALRARWRETLGVTTDEVDRAYAILRWADTFSLVLCRRRVPFGGRQLELERGPDGRRYDVRRRSDGALTVEPWPYARQHFKVAVDTYRLRQLTFDDPEALAEVLHTAPMVRRIWELAAPDAA